MKKAVEAKENKGCDVCCFFFVCSSVLCGLFFFFWSVILPILEGRQCLLSSTLLTGVKINHLV